MQGAEAPSAEAVALSLLTGDHWARRGRSDWLRLAVLLARAAARSRPVRPGERPAGGRVVLLCASPVAHGARLAAAVGQALEPLVPQVALDVRLADPALLSRFDVVHDVPSLALPSLVSWASRQSAVRALQCWWASRALRPTSQRRASRVTWAYLMIAQRMRYDIAAQVPLTTPDGVLLVDFDRSAFCAPWLHAARMRGTPTATLVHGAPSELFYLPVLADAVCAWSERQADWWREMAPEVDVAVVGRIEIAAESAEAPKDPIEWSGGHRVLVLHSAEALTQLERDRLVTIVASLSGRGWRCDLRVHPSVPVDRPGAGWSEVVAAGARPSSARTTELDAVLEHVDLVLGVSSTAVLDAVAAGRPVGLVVDPSRRLPVDLESLRAAGGLLYDAVTSGDPEWWGDWRALARTTQEPAWDVEGRDARARLLSFMESLLERRAAGA